MRSCHPKADKCFHVLGECHSNEQGSIMIFDRTRDGLMWNYSKKQMSSIGERERLACG